MTPIIRVAAALLHDDRGRMLVVRKVGTAIFMQPGGKIDRGESAEQALCRELLEELSITCRESMLRPLGRFSCEAANEPGHRLDATLFALSIEGDPTPAAEIAEAVWIAPEAPGPRLLAPFTREHVLPLARKIARRD